MNAGGDQRSRTRARVGEERSTVPLILASASPRRRGLLTDAGFSFRVISADIDEESAVSAITDPVAQARQLAFLKARAVADRLTAGVVLGADTLVSAGGRVFNKPADAADARRILTELMHLRHDVITGFALIDAATGESEVYDELTRLHMRPMAPQELDAYIASGLWQGKAGAYGVQDHDDAFVTHLDGSFSNVVGLPVETVAAALARWGIHPCDPASA
jgi:septum formation protein